jgi:hypothetical protein
VPACSQFDFYGNCIGYLALVNQRMTDTTISLGGKYAFLHGRVRPTVGALFAYSKRSFENINNYSYVYNGYYQNRQQYPDSWAVDGGLSLGADVKLSERFHIGADFRYFMNLTYDRADNPQTRYYGNSTPIEELSYYIFSLSATLRF